MIFSELIVINENKEVLGLYSKERKRYDQPGGFVDPAWCQNPTNPSQIELQKAALTRAFEKLGDDLKFDQFFLVATVPFEFEDGAKATAYQFFTRIKSGNPVNNAADKYDHIKWLSVADLDSQPLGPALANVKDQVKKILER